MHMWQRFPILILLVAGTAQAGGPAVSFETRTINRLGLQPFGVAVADFNADGKPDAAFSAAAGGLVTIMTGNGDGTFARPVYFPADRMPRGLAAGDLNGDGKPDVVITISLNNEIRPILSNSKGGFDMGKAYHAGDRPFAVAIGDLDEDGNNDVAVANETNIPPQEAASRRSRILGKGEVTPDGIVSVFLGQGNGQLSSHLQLTAGKFPADVQIADLDGDRHLDIIVANWGSNDVNLFFGNGKGGFPRKRSLKEYAQSPYSVQVADFNGDGHLDLVVPHMLNRWAQILGGDGKGEFVAGHALATGEGCRSLAAADFNADGRPDIACASTGSNAVSLSLSTEKGTFLSGPLLRTGSAPRSLATADLNTDGLPDLIVTNLNSNTATVFLNTTGKAAARQNPGG